MSKTTYVIIENPVDDREAYTPYGSARAFWRCHDTEVIMSGPAETGKTRVGLEKLDALMWKYAGAQSAIVRKSYKSMPGSVLQTFAKVIGDKSPIRIYGGERPEFYEYPNGSRIWIGGMDNPDKVLSSERDFVYANQAEELELNEWETLLTRCTGRAGNAPYSQMMGDCNPSYPRHWIKDREKAGKLTIIESRHGDNPLLYDQRTKQITPQGIRTMAILDSLTGTRKARLRYGRWVQAEGVVYENYDEAIHLIPRFEIPRDWRRLRVIDFGLVHPFVCQWWAIDDDGRMYRYREIYMTGRTVTTHAKQINELSIGEDIDETICDHDAEDRLTLEENGISNIPAYKDVPRGIGEVQERLKKQADNRPRIFFLRDSLVEIDQALENEKKPICTEDEFGAYIWNDKKAKDEPVKQFDHGMDTMRYAVMYELEGSHDVVGFVRMAWR